MSFLFLFLFFNCSVGQSEEIEFVLDPCEDEDSPSGLPPTQSTYIIMLP